MVGSQTRKDREGAHVRSPHSWKVGSPLNLDLQINRRFPDFKHKQTQESLWLDDARNPPWVQTELAAIPPGTLQSNVFAWDQWLKGLVKAKQYKKTMEVFHKMLQERIRPDTWTFLPVLNACAGLGALDEGRRVHTQIIQVGCESDIYVATSLIDMYAKCGSIQNAWSVFNKMRKQNVVTWNAMIGGYGKSGQGRKAMELFWKMKEEAVEPNAITFIGVLNACASISALEEGRRVHKQIIQAGYESDICMANCLVDMYAKCGSTEDAWIVFNKMREHDVVSWNTLIGGYVKSGNALKAIELFRRMQQDGLEPNVITLIGVLNACASAAALKEGRDIHTKIIKVGYESDVYVANCLVDMYAKCGSIDDAWDVFHKMVEHDVVTWNAMIGGCVKSGQGLKSMELFQEMQQEGVEPDAVTFVRVLNACGIVADLEEGRRVHTQVLQSGYEADVYVATCLVDMYCKCGSVEDAWSIFNKMQDHNVVTWNAMIGGYAMHGQPNKAIGLFELMGKEGVKMDGITFICLLSACSHGGLVKEGVRYLKSMISCFDLRPTTEHYACVVDLLGRAGWLLEAEELIKRVPLDTDVSIWMCLLGACRIHGDIAMAERAVKRCQELDPGNALGRVRLPDIFAGPWKWERIAGIARERSGRGARWDLD